jgi:enediyne biosynthesis protein E4
VKNFHRSFLALVLLGAGGGCQQQPASSPQAVPAPVPVRVVPAAPSNTSERLRFTECAKEWGAYAEYRDGSEQELFTILESLGGGVGVLDYDRDGTPDLYFPQGGQFEPSKQPFGNSSRLLRQVQITPQPMYVDVSGKCGGVISPHYSHGAAITDYDNDGFDDVLVTGYGGLQLFRNLGDGTFEEVSQPVGLTDTQWSSSAAWGDFNGDGANDLYVAHYADWSPENDPPCYFRDQTTRDVCPPREFAGLPNIVYLSDGAGGFLSPGNAFGDVSQGKGLGVAAADVDLDGDIDVYVANDNAMNSLLVK